MVNRPSSSRDEGGVFCYAMGMKDATALPPRFYVDADVFSRLREGLFFRSWQYACHESQVAEAGCYHAFSLLDQDILLVRGADGTLRGFYNVCQHRGHILVTAGAGQARLLTCPYHSWSYDLQGRLRAAPGLAETAGICLTPVRVEVFLGFVFVNLDEAAPAMEEAYPDVVEAVSRLVPEIGGLQLAHQHEALEECNWLVAMANYNECYHCKNAHRAFSKGVVDPASYDIQPFSGGRVLHHSARGVRAEDAWYGNGGGDTDYNSFYLFPSFSLQIYPGRLVNAYHWRPLDVENTQVWRSWFSANGTVDAALQAVIDLDRDTTLAEDIALVKATQRGLHSRGYRPGPLVIKPEGGIDSEHSVAVLHGWVEEMLA